jgi:hypothetical protein
MFGMADFEPVALFQVADFALDSNFKIVLP